MHNDLSGEFILTPNNEEKESSAPKKSKHSHKTSPHFYSSFVEHPKNITFSDQKANEEIILIVRRHFVTNVPWIVAAILLGLFPITLLPIIIEFFPFTPPGLETNILIALFFYLVVFGFVLLRFTLWYFHVGILTNLRIRDIDIHGILFKDVSETNNEFIQDVNHSQIGFIRSLFNYGEVMVQTAGTKPNIEFDKAPRPAKIAQIIVSLLGSK
jgi:membrane protein YdbS with pleckstrin-like domain